MKVTYMKLLLVVVSIVVLNIQNISVKALTKNHWDPDDNYITPIDDRNLDHNKRNSSRTTKDTLPSISKEEKDLFARLVEAEAKGESYKGKVAVATVVLNRVESPQFPNNVTDVIRQVVGNSYAFSPVQNGQINQPASEESKRAIDEALNRSNRLNNAVYFYNPDIATDEWIRTREVVKTIGNHTFAK